MASALLLFAFAIRAHRSYGLMELLLLALLLGPILEESLFPGMFTPIHRSDHRQCWSPWFSLRCCLPFFTSRPIWRIGYRLPRPVLLMAGSEWCHGQQRQPL